MRLPHPPLLVVTDRRQARQPLPDIVGTVLATGCRWVSLRERDLPDADQIALVGSLLPVVRRFESRLTLHGDAQVAARCGLDGVHLSSNGNQTAARTVLGSDKLIGISIHSAAEAAAVDPRSVDYAIAGPFNETQSKPGYGPALGRVGLAEIVKASPVPVVAIGGIDAATVGTAVAAGAAGVAVMGSIMRSADPAKDTGLLLAALGRTYPRPRYVATP